jgi:type IV secretory pathway VirB10-like protein
MSELIREAMRWAGNIPPTLHVNQGAGVGIFVARPIDMSGVYRLEPGTELP